jgi:hypothetical protein
MGGRFVLNEDRPMTDNTFQRERRYIVIKRKHLTDGQERNIREYLDDIGAHTIRAVVVEEDWPEYEPVWQMIEARVSGGAAPQPDASALVEAVKRAAKNADVALGGVLLHATDWLALMDALAAMGKAD